MVLQDLCEIIHPKNLKVDLEMQNDLMCMCVLRDGPECSKAPTGCNAALVPLLILHEARTSMQSA